MARAHQGDAVRPRIEHGDHHAREPIVPASAQETFIDQRHSLGKIAFAGETVTHVGRQRRHHQGRRHTLPGDIGQHERQSPLRQRYVGEKVSAHVLRRFVIVEHLVAFDLRWLCRQQSLLHAVGQFQIALELFLLNTAVVGDGLLNGLRRLAGDACEYLQVGLIEAVENIA